MPVPGKCYARYIRCIIATAWKARCGDEYEDGSVDYETSFTDIEDFNESYYCILKCIGKEVGIATDNPKVLTYACVIRGKEEIEKELLHGNGKQLEYI